MRVFIADDSRVVRERLINMLSEIPGVEVVGEAESAQEAIVSLQELKPDAVIVDIRMPGGNGINLLRHIKKEHSESIAIMLTNYPYAQYRLKCMEEGADFFFDKSSEFEKIVEVFKKLT